MIRPRTETLAQNLRSEGIPVAVSLRNRRADPDLIIVSDRVAVEVFGGLSTKVCLIKETKTGFHANLIDLDDVITLVREAMAEAI